MTTKYAPIQVQAPEDVATTGLARWMIFGLNGAGKTQFLSTVPPEVPMLVVSADDENVDVLRGFKHIKVVKINRWSQLGEVYQMLATKLAEPAVISGEKRFFKAVAFDTWSRIQALARNKIVGYEPAEASEVVKYIDRAPTLPKGFDNWQQIGALAGEWMRNFCRLPIHTIFLAQEDKYDPKNDRDDVQVKAALTKWALTEAMTALKLVGRLYVDHEDAEGNTLDALSIANPMQIREDVKEVRKLLVGKHQIYMTKGDTLRLGYVVREPTWAKLAQALFVDNQQNMPAGLAVEKAL